MRARAYTHYCDLQMSSRGSVVDLFPHPSFPFLSFPFSGFDEWLNGGREGVMNVKPTRRFVNARL